MIAYGSVQIVDIVSQACPGGRRRRKGRRQAPAPAENVTLRKMENSGNEAKKYLKTKEVTLLNDAILVHFACKTTPGGPEKHQKAPHFARTNRSVQAAKRGRERDKESATSTPALRKCREDSRRGTPANGAVLPRKKPLTGILFSPDLLGAMKHPFRSLKVRLQGFFASLRMTGPNGHSAAGVATLRCAELAHSRRWAK